MRRARREPGDLGERLAAARDVEPCPVHAGVDEAGLGPLLGPLAIGYCALRVPRSDIDPWQALRAVVSARPASDKRRVVVADSKAVFDRTSRGEVRLETTALAFLALTLPGREVPRDGCALLALGPSGIPAGAPLPSAPWGEPWAARLDARLPRAVDAQALELKIARLAREMERTGLALPTAGVRALPVPALNASFRATDNKGRSHWDACAPVLLHLWTAHAAEGLFAVVDRHGGRARYGDLLAETFPAAAVERILETESYSEYRLEERSPARRMRIAFVEKSERHSFAVALASCLAKYARETCMHAFNAHFGALQPGLRPTAGYRQDGWRWLAEARTAIERSGAALADLVRER